MKIISPLLLLFVLAVPCLAQHYSCLSNGITEGTIISSSVTQLRRGGKSVKKVTAGEKLRSLGARCFRGQLVDAGRRQIRFFQLEGCWGSPPEGYQEILAKQQRVISDLRRRYNVIEVTCNTSGEQIP